MELNFKVFGQGQPLIILHGLFGSLDNWQTMAKQFSEHFMVFVLDQRNHGKSPHAAPHDYPTLANDLKEFLEQNWVYRAHILGHSMGGKVAMQFALEYPEMVDKLVVADIAPTRYAPHHDAVLDALGGIKLELITSRKDAETQIRQFIKDDEPTVQFMLKNLSRLADGSYEWKMNAPVLVSNYLNILDDVVQGSAFEGETLFVRGELSNYVSDEKFKEAQTRFPNARLETIKGAGHWLHADAPEAFYEVVNGFLS